jgi:hypothetical protein
MKLLDGRGHRNHFLNDLSSNQRRNETRARSSEENAVLLRGEFVVVFQPREKIQDFFRLFGVVAFVSLGEQLTFGRDEDEFAGGAANVDPASFTSARRMDRFANNARLRRESSRQRLNLDEFFSGHKGLASFLFHSC